MCEVDKHFEVRDFIHFGVVSHESSNAVETGRKIRMMQIYQVFDRMWDKIKVSGLKMGQKQSWARNEKNWERKKIIRLKNYLLLEWTIDSCLVQWSHDSSRQI